MSSPAPHDPTAPAGRGLRSTCALALLLIILLAGAENLARREEARICRAAGSLKDSTFKDTHQEERRVRDLLSRSLTLRTVRPWSELIDEEGVLVARLLECHQELGYALLTELESGPPPGRRDGLRRRLRARLSSLRRDALALGDEPCAGWSSSLSRSDALLSFRDFLARRLRTIDRESRESEGD